MDDRRVTGRLDRFGRHEELQPVGREAQVGTDAWTDGSAVTRAGRLVGLWSGIPTQNLLRRAARGGSVGRWYQVGNALY